MPLLKYISMEIMRGCFHKAIEHNQFDLVKQLIKKGAAINVTDEAGSTALYKAAIGGNHEIVRLLLENRAQVNGRNDQGFTALEISVIKIRQMAFACGQKMFGGRQRKMLWPVM